jgi:hypothetical protein
VAGGDDIAVTALPGPPGPDAASCCGRSCGVKPGISITDHAQNTCLTQVLVAPDDLGASPSLSPLPEFSDVNGDDDVDHSLRVFGVAEGTVETADLSDW